MFLVQINLYLNLHANETDQVKWYGGSHRYSLMLRLSVSLRRKLKVDVSAFMAIIKDH